MTEPDLEKRLENFDAVIDTLSAIRPKECPSRDVLAASLLPKPQVIPSCRSLSCRRRWTLSDRSSTPPIPAILCSSRTFSESHSFASVVPGSTSHCRLSALSLQSRMS